MSTVTPAKVRLFITNYVNLRLEATGRSSREDLPDDCDLLLSGMIDSIGLLDLMEALREFCRRDIDFEMIDPEEMTVVGPLCKFLSAQMEEQS